MIPSLSADACDAVLEIRDTIEGMAPVDGIREVLKDTADLETYVTAMQLKSAEVNALLAEAKTAKQLTDIVASFGVSQIGAYVEQAISLAMSYRDSKDLWQTIFTPPEVGKEAISGVFFSVLYNMLRNVVRWGWQGCEVAEMSACIWVRRETRGRRRGYLTCVGNTGKPCEGKSLEMPSSLANQAQKGRIGGLLVMKQILQRLGGDLCCPDKSKVFDTRSNVPDQLDKCCTFFEFFCPSVDSLWAENHEC